MSTAISLAPRLALTRLRSREGGAILDALAVLAFTVSTWLALTVAGGTVMFVNRSAGYGGLTGNSSPMQYVANSEMIFAFVACALLVFPILGLGAAAARLGARGRARRLASLRLLGMTGSDVVSMSLVETLVQAAAGIVLGAAVYLASLPLWRFVSFQDEAIAGGEMVVPWWLGLAVAATVLALAALSTIIGLQQVRISPLGVSRNQTPRALKAWRVLVLVVAVVAFIVVAQGMNFFAGELAAYLIIAGMIALVVGGINLVGPFILQLAALPFTRTRRVSQLVAMRRIADDPRAAWRNVSAVALITMIAAFFAVAPTEFLGGGSPDDGDPWSFAGWVLAVDVKTGVYITLLIGLVLVAVQVLMTQASTVFDRASESVAMDRMGMPRGVFGATRRVQVLMPLVVTLVVSGGVGFLLASPFLLNPYLAGTGVGLAAAGVAQLGLVAALGVVMTLLAVEACGPLQAMVLSEQRRRND